MNKPNLVDIKTVSFFNNINKNIHLDNTPVKVQPKFTGRFDYLLLNITIISVIIIFGYILYKRYKMKKINKLIYNNKINKLYNNINNYKDE